MTETVSTNLDISDTKATDWKYVAEGGATIVFAYIGPLHPLFTGTVLRLRKIKHNKSHPNALEKPAVSPSLSRGEGEEGIGAEAEGAEGAKHAEDEEQDDPMIAFQEQVIGRLIPEQFLVNLRVVRLDRKWLAEFADYHDGPGLGESGEGEGGARPASRKNVDGIDVGRQKGVLADNLVGGEGMCTIEIKPKWGYLPSPTHLSDATLPIKSQTCRTCMHNSLRLSKGHPAASNFCPLDLYSGDESRTRRALEGLWDDWMRSEGKINNLRVFDEGKVVRPGVDEDMRKWAESMIGWAGTGHSASDRMDVGVETMKEQFTNLLLPVILATPVFKLLATLQRTLDPLDREGYVALRQFVKSTTSSSVSPTSPEYSALQTTETEPDLNEWRSFVDAYLSTHDMMDLHSPTSSMESLRYYTLAYMLSATFKDCSVVVRILPPTQSVSLPSSAPLSPPPQSSNTTEASEEIIGVDEGEERMVQVKVIDLDPKTVKKITQWERLDEEIVEAYASVAVDERKVCQDSIP